MNQATANLDISALTPERDALNTPYWDSLAKGVLSFQRCDACEHAWLPARSECPGCLTDQWQWVPATGGAKLGDFTGFDFGLRAAGAEACFFDLDFVRADLEQVEGELALGARYGSAGLVGFEAPERDFGLGHSSGGRIGYGTFEVTGDLGKGCREAETSEKQKEA